MQHSLRDEKGRFRDKHKSLRINLPKDEKSVRDRKIYEFLIKTMAYKDSSQILMYSALPLEVSTSEIFKKAVLDGKKCYFPKCFDYGKMEFYSAEGTELLEKGRFGIFEPVPDADKKYKPKNFDICIVPALAYDQEGYRMGFGKGFYDRFLSSFAGTKIGICYRENIETCLPRGRYDIHVDILITEKGLFKLKKR